MDVAEWQRRLEDTFRKDGIIGQRLLKVIKQENEYGDYVINTFQGYVVLQDCFFDFFIDTLRRASHFAHEHGVPKEATYYNITLLSQTINLKSFRAAENLLLKGYPLDGYALLRDLKDRAIFQAGIMQGIVSFKKLHGHDIFESATGNLSSDSDLYKKAKKQQKRLEHKILNLFLREKSGFDKDTINELKNWERMFHEEVHGSRFTFSLEGLDWLKGESPISIGPVPNKNAISMYLNRSNEIGWMLLRTLPVLQLKQKALGDEWSKKWYILDDSFRYSYKSLAEMGKKIGYAILKLIDSKFNFNPTYVYKD
jgi:hypothetical protein